MTVVRGPLIRHAQCQLVEFCGKGRVRQFNILFEAVLDECRSEHSIFCEIVSKWKLCKCFLSLFKNPLGSGSHYWDYRYWAPQYFLFCLLLFRRYTCHLNQKNFFALSSSSDWGSSSQILKGYDSVSCRLLLRAGLRLWQIVCFFSFYVEMCEIVAVEPP